jgi:mono/diheme cytochrome c family protein
MNMKFKALTGLAIVSVSALILGSCKANADSPGLEYMPDMYRSPAIEPYVDYGDIRGRINEDVKLKQSALIPPAGTIPYVGKDSETVFLMLPYFRKANIAFRETHGLYGMDLTTADEYTASVSDINPYKLTAKNTEGIFKKGKELYTAMCQHCHGEKGDGNGPMVVSGAYAGVPNYSDRASLGDGQMFYSIYYGKGAMGSHASLLSKKEIWTLVHYVRKFQNAEYGKFDASGAVAVSKAPVTADTTTKN